MNSFQIALSVYWGVPLFCIFVLKHNNLFPFNKEISEESGAELLALWFLGALIPVLYIGLS